MSRGLIEQLDRTMIVLIKDVSKLSLYSIQLMLKNMNLVKHNV